MAHPQRLSSWFALQVLLFILHSPKLATSTVYSVKDVDKYDRDIQLFQHFNEPFEDQKFGQLNIDVLQATTSSIHVQWALTNVSYPDSVIESTVLCETSNGKIVSEKLHTTVTSFHFQFLTSNTKYLVCVHLLEKSKSIRTSILHYSCQPVATIPMVRSDSIAGVLLCIGYLVLMGAVGYITWYRRATRVRRREGDVKIKIEETEEDTDHLNGGPVKAGSSKRMGVSNSAVDGFHSDGDGVNGGATYKDARGRTDNVGTCGRLDQDDTATPQSNINKRQVSF